MQIPGRDDISENLVHFTKGETDDAAAAVLRAILDECRLVGGTGYIRGQYQCVCFTEAPLDKIAPTIAQAHRQGRRYRCFGILIGKSWLYAQGGRPVIYGPEEQFDQLPDEHKWRHVRYEPDREDPIDFTWEREWRIQTPELAIHPGNAWVLVPSVGWAESLAAEHERHQDMIVRELSQIMDEDEARSYRDPFPWRIEIVGE